MKTIHRFLSFRSNMLVYCSLFYLNSLSLLLTSGRGDGGGSGGRGAETGNNSIPCVTFVSCQQAASGAPKCTICDHQVCGAIMLLPAASDDENVLDRFCFGWRGATGISLQEDGNVCP